MGDRSFLRQEDTTDLLFKLVFRVSFTFVLLTKEGSIALNLKKEHYICINT